MNRKLLGLMQFYIPAFGAWISLFGNIQAQKFENIAVAMPSKNQIKFDRPYRKMLEYNKMSVDSSILLLNKVFEKHFAKNSAAEFVATDYREPYQIVWFRDSVKLQIKSFGSQSIENSKNKPFELLPAITEKKQKIAVKRFKKKDEDKKLALQKHLQGKHLLAINRIRVNSRLLKRGRMKASVHCELFDFNLAQTEVRRLDLILPFRKKMFFTVLEMKLREELNKTFK